MVLLCLTLVCISDLAFLKGSGNAAAAAETGNFPATQDAFVSNFNGQGDSVGITLNANKLIYGKFRHAYLKFDLSSIDTDRYKIDEMQMVLNFRKSHSPNELVFTESESTLQDTNTEWTVNNLTYNARPNDMVDSPIVTQQVTSNGEENVSIDLSTIFQSALSSGRKVISIHLTTSQVNDSTISASELYASRNTSGYTGPSLAVTLGNPIVSDGTDKTALNTLIAQTEQLKQGDYTADSWSVLAGALNQAKQVSMSSVTQEEVNLALLSLQSAMDNLDGIELPSKIAGPDMGNYFNNSQTASKIFKMKNSEGRYVKVDPVTEKLSLTTDAAQASAFALYVLDYFATVDHSEPEVGATRTTYSIKSLVNNKYLSIQNYFTAEQFLSNTHHYYNILSGDQNGTSTDRTFEIKASATIPNWNERFYVDHYVNSDYYRIWSHLSTMRDDQNFNTFNVTMTDDAMQSSGLAALNNEYRFYWEEVTDQDQLEVSQQVSGDDVELFWKPVNGDTNAAHYSIDGNSVGIVYADGLMRVTRSDLSVGVHKYNVAYIGSGYEVNSDVNVRIFSHPGILHTTEDLNRMKQHVQAKEEPWYSDYERLLNTVPYDVASPDYETTVFSNVGRGGAPSDSAYIGYFEKGGNAAYFNALQWVITGDDTFAARAVDILNKWAKSLKVIDGRDRILGAGINAYKYANAAEIIKYYNGGYSEYSAEDFKALQDMMINVVYPVIQDAAVPMIANGNWDVAAIVSMISIGVLGDNADLFDRAMALYQDIHVNGSIFAYVNDSGQTMETGRDQAHAMLAIGYMAEICLIANNQDEDLYSLYNNRLAKAFEYLAKYNLYSKELYGEDLPFVAMPNVFADTTRGYYGAGFDRDSNGLNRGELRPVFEQGLALYSKVSGVDMTWTARAAAAARPQAMVHFDNLNFGTLTFYNGEPLTANGPYFQLRTRWEPLYQRNWSTVDGQRVAETLNSYFDIDANGELVTSVMKQDAPFYQLVTNDDGTYSIRVVSTNTYLSVKEDQVGDYNIMKADAVEIGDNEKFVLQSTGVGPYFLVSPKYDNRIVYQYVSGSGNDSVLTLRLGIKKQSDVKDTPDVTTNERLIFMYNTEEVALRGIPVPTVPGAPTELTAVPGDKKVTLAWKAPGSDGGASITKYEVSRDNGSTWMDAATDIGHTFNGLTNGVTYTFKVRAVNSTGNSEAAVVKAMPVSSAGVIIPSSSTSGETENGNNNGNNGETGGNENTGNNENNGNTGSNGSTNYYELAFNDVPSSHWAANNIAFVSSLGLFKGTSVNTFSPNVSMTRAMFAQVLANLEGTDLSDYTESVFIDVPEQHWYTGAVTWAAKSGIINGTGQGKFDPNGNITREQMAVMLYNYAVSKGYKLPASTNATFVDSGNVSAWASEAVAAIAAAGIINGKGDDRFEPQVNASRAEVAAVFARMIRVLGMDHE
ncbi:S-layer homology domain-containing protein [Paenibacillus cellulosilyticus]|nr:S-layer homology domain-containing protein [Paenibacillus cellulosilyticus]QKS45236.1 S-layer homology domain-containing protein [Paenibacillus cellulosilyticus]